jgi:hypothetical protein
MTGAGKENLRPIIAPFSMPFFFDIALCCRSTTIMAPNKTTTVSPSSGSKHQRPEVKESRRVSQRIDASAPTIMCPVTSIKECIKGISRSYDKDFTRESLITLSSSLDRNSRDSKRVKQGVFVSVGGPLVIVNVLRKYLQDRPIQEHGMMILAKMTSPDERASYECIQRVCNAVADVDGISVVLETLAKYYATKSIQADGLATLRNLTNNQGVKCGQENVNTIVCKEDGVPIIIEAMDMHLHDDEVVVKAVELLDFLSQDGSQSILKAMIKAKAASALSRAIEDHEDNADIQRVARHAMTTLMENR